MDEKFQEAQILSQKLQTDLFDSIKLQNKLNTKISRQKKSLKGLFKKNKSLREQLQTLTLAHKEGQIALQKLTKCHIEMHTHYAQQLQSILKWCGARLDLQTPLDIFDKQEVDSIKTDLQLAKGCVGVILKCPHGSAYFLEKVKQQLEAEYRETLQKKDAQITDLLEQKGTEAQ